MDCRAHEAPRAVAGAPPRPPPSGAHPTARQIAEIVREHSAFVWRTLRFLGVRSADLDDACQEVFLVVCRKLGSFEARSSIKTWLRGICVKTAAAYRRKAYVRREVPVESPDRDQASPGSPEQEMKSKEQLALLDRALDALDGDKRDVFVLYEIEELTMREVAEAVGCPLQTAYSRYHAAKERITESVRRASAEARAPELSAHRIEALVLGVLEALSMSSPEGEPDTGPGERDLGDDPCVQQRVPDGLSAPLGGVSSGGTSALATLGALAALVIAGGLGLVASRGPEPIATTPSSREAPAAERPTGGGAHAVAPTGGPAAVSVRLDELPDHVPPGASPPPAATAPPETELLSRAQRALGGDPAAALAHCDEHLARYPGGALTQEREVIAIAALVRLGRVAEARSRAERFEAAYPGSGHLRRIDVLLGE